MNFLSNSKIQKSYFKIWKQYQNCDKMTGLLVKRTKILKSRYIFDITNCPWIANIEVDLGGINDWKKGGNQPQNQQFGDNFFTFFNDQLLVLDLRNTSKTQNSSLLRSRYPKKRILGPWVEPQNSGIFHGKSAAPRGTRSKQCEPQLKYNPISNTTSP